MFGLRSGWSRNRSGSVALIAALVTPVLLMCGGASIDLWMLMMWRTQLQDAADACAVAAVARNSPAYQAALNMTSDGDLSGSGGPAQATSVFNANLGNSAAANVSDVHVTITKTGPTVSSTVTATGTFTPSFLGLIGIHGITSTVTSGASDNIPSYVNFYMLLDNTPSMGLGATDSDISTLTAKTNCAFACHATNNPNEDYYTVAKSLGVTMRIDVVRQAVQQLMSTAASTEQANGVQNEYQVAMYDFGSAAYAGPALNPVSALTPNLLGQSQSDAGSIDLMTVPDNNYAYNGSGGEVANNDEDTSFDYALSSLSNIISAGGAVGNGNSAAAPQQVLFFVTDGMVDMNGGSGRSMGGINPATCTALKSKGIKVAILYTTYLPSSIANDPWSQANVAPLLPQVGPALQSCASPGLYYEVSPSQGISQAMAALFQTVIASVRITG